MSVPEILNTRADEICGLYPDRHSAVMPLLYLIQEQFGSITDEGILWVSEKTGLAPIHVREVSTFYTMYYQKPVGKYHIQICRTLSCALRGCKELTEAVASKYRIKAKEVSSDGMFSFEEVECLGSCGTAPMAQINDTFFENLDGDKLLALLERIKKEKPDLRLSTVADALGSGLAGAPKSEVI